MPKNLIYIGVAFLAWLGYKKYSLSQKINISLNDFGFAGGNILEPKINVKLKIENPTNTSADIQKITGEILLKDKIIGNIYKDVNQKILSKKDTIINFDVKLNLKNIGLIFFQNGLKNQKILIKGNVVVDFIFFPFIYEIQLP